MKIACAFVVCALVLCAFCAEAVERRHHKRRVPGHSDGVSGSQSSSSSQTSSASQTASANGFLPCDSMWHKGTCKTGGGYCIDTEKIDCSGELIKGLCPGKKEVRCCRSLCRLIPETPASKYIINKKPANAARGKHKVPSFKRLVDAYPMGSSADVKTRLGGGVDAAWIENTCAIRMSYTLSNASGGNLTFPASADRPVVKDKDKRALYFRVAVLKKWVVENLGLPDIEVKVKDRDPKVTGIDPVHFHNKTGIIEFTIAWTDATGHFDLWNGEKMVECSHQEQTARYFSLAREVRLWIADPEPAWQMPNCGNEDPTQQQEADVAARDN